MILAETRKGVGGASGKGFNSAARIILAETYEIDRDRIAALGPSIRPRG